MKEKIKIYWQRFKNTLEKYLIQFTCATVIVIVIMFVCVACNIIDKASQTETVSSQEVSETVVEWGSGITEGVPAFSGELTFLDSKGQGYAAAYYSNVSLEQVEEYSKQLETQLKIEFSHSGKFPKTVIWNDKIITLHYNVTEMEFSVTVTAKSN